MANFIHDSQSQEFFDSYNNFIMSDDIKVLGKLFSKFRFLEAVKNIPGDIVELGVFKGSGLFSWLKVNRLTSFNAKKVYGFDIFDQEKLVSSLSGQQKEMMANLFKQRSFGADEAINYEEFLKKSIKNAGFDNCLLIKGDVTETVPCFVESNPGFRASLVNFDLDVDKPTYVCLEALWERITPGGIAIFDEYATNEWDESNAVDRFIKDKNIKLISTNLACPTAYIIKN